MNKKIYFNNACFTLTEGVIQPSGNQLIVNTAEVSDDFWQQSLKEFIQQNTKQDLIFICKNVDSFFEKLKKQFIYIEAAGGLITQNKKYLFIYRLDKWDLPKGKLDKGENPPQAAIRECEEECAITGLTIIKELPSSYHIYPYKGHHALKITYWYLMTSTHKGKLIPQTEENIEKVEWLDLNTINSSVKQNTYPSVLDLISVSIDN